MLLTRALALVYHYIHKVCTRKKKRLLNSMHTSECKKKNTHTAHGYRYISVHDASTMNRCVKTFFFCPAYQHTDNMAYLLVCIWAVCSQKNHSKNYVYSIQFLQHLILRCAQSMCTAHNNYVQVMHMTYRQAWMLYRARVV